jgi:hypothetical protein
MAVCNKTGAIAIYNEAKSLFLSPYSDGPINFHTNPDGTMNIRNVSKFGRSFSLLRIPYSFKLLIQELQIMNIQMRIITDENVDQLLSMSYSNNINKLLHNKDDKSVEKTSALIKDFVRKMEMEQTKSSDLYVGQERPLLPSSVDLDTESSHTPPFPPPEYIDKRTPSSDYGFWKTGYSPPYAPGSNSPPYAPGSNSPPYAPGSNSPPYAPGSNSPPYAPDSNSPPYAPGSNSPPYAPGSNSPPYIPGSDSPVYRPNITPPNPSILDVPKEQEEKKEEKNKSSSSSDSSDKKVIEIPNQSSSDVSTSSGTKKITIQ